MISVCKHKIEAKFFPDGTFNLMNFPEIDNRSLCIPPIIDIEWYFENISEQILLYNIVKHLKNIGYDTSCILLFMPYVPNARMDRIYCRDKEVSTLKFFADFINDLHFKHVIILDPHSDTTTILLDRCSTLSREYIFEKVLNISKPDVILYPDAGAMKRYVADSKNLPILVAEKIRDWNTGKIQELEIKNPWNIEFTPETKVLISDDICSKGTTFYYAAKALNELGVTNIELYVTHCENSIMCGKLLEPDSPINRIYTTTSIVRNFTSPKITEISLENIYNVNF